MKSQRSSQSYEPSQIYEPVNLSDLCKWPFTTLIALNVWKKWEDNQRSHTLALTLWSRLRGWQISAFVVGRNELVREKEDAKEAPPIAPAPEVKFLEKLWLETPEVPDSRGCIELVQSNWLGDIWNEGHSSNK